MPVHTILPATVGPSQILDYNERYRHLQLAEQLVRETCDILPIGGPVALFFCQDLTEPELQLVDLHARILLQQRWRVPNAG